MIHADPQLVEIGIVSEYDKFDVSMAMRGSLEDNSFQIVMSAADWLRSPISEGDYLYIPETEQGGRVEQIKHSTAQGTITLTGATWRGMLAKKVLEPPEEETHFAVPDMEANAAIGYVLSGLFNGFYAASGVDTGISVLGLYRYKSVLYVLEDLLDLSGMRLDCKYRPDTQTVLVSAVPASDYSELIELSQDYGVGMVTTSGRLDNYNHVIALGRGELENRDILHLYRMPDGSIVEEKPVGWDDATEASVVYDYSNAETLDDLRSNAIKKMKSYGAEKTIQIDVSAAGIALELGDIVAARDRLTGIQGTVKVGKKIVTITENGVETQVRAETD